MATIEQLRRLFRVKKNELVMMKTRGYRLDVVYIKCQDKFIPVNMSNFDSLTFEQFIKYRQDNNCFRTRFEFTSIYFKDNTEPVIVVYLESDPGKKVNAYHFQYIRDIISNGIFPNLHTHHIIIISENGLNTAIIASIEHEILGYKIETFTDMNFALNPTNHCLVPLSIKHIPSENINEWGKKEMLTPQQLPMYLTIDPIARWYGASPLDIFEVIRLGSSVEKEWFANICRKPPPEKKK